MEAENNKFYTASLAEMMLRNAREYPDNGIGLIDENGEINFIKYSELLETSLLILSNLYKTGISKGDKLIIATESNKEIICSLWACFLGNLVPTILQAPLSFSEINPSLEKLKRVSAILGGPYIIMTKEDASYKDELFPDKVLAYTKLNTGKKTISVSDIEMPSPDAMAFIQFSSGSTGDPKGVVLSHKNIMTNLWGINEGILLTQADISLNWMPLYHDMGLFGFHLTFCNIGSTHYLMDVIDFIKKPSKWLHLIDRLKATITSCPNFAQAIVNKHFSREADNKWDLSSLRLIFNGAEPISPIIMDDFMSHLSKYGCSKTSMFPVYGLAEATLAVSFSGLTDLPLVRSFDRKKLFVEGLPQECEKAPSSFNSVSVGKAINYTEIRIVNEKSIPLGEDKLGQVQVRGHNVCLGYINHERNSDIFDGEWLRTGDLGFVYKGDLFIVGRYKDVIFQHGKNLYANDLESLALNVEGVNFGKIVIGGVFDEVRGNDRILAFIVGSPNKSSALICQSIHKLFRESLGVTVSTFIPIRSNQIPKTSSGKIQRYKLISAYLKGMYDENISKMETLLKDSSH